MALQWRPRRQKKTAESQQKKNAEDGSAMAEGPAEDGSAM